MFEVRFDKDARSFLKKLSRPVARRIFAKTLAAKETPHRFFEHLKGKPEFKLRVGDYRVIADIDDEKLLIEIRLIGHRKDVYERSYFRSYL